MSASATLTLNEGNYDPNQGVQWIDDGDKALYVTFYKHPVDGEDHVKIVYPGDDKTVGDFLATEYYQNRFRQPVACLQGRIGRVRRSGAHRNRSLDRPRPRSMR